MTHEEAKAILRSIQRHAQKGNASPVAFIPNEPSEQHEELADIYLAGVTAEVRRAKLAAKRDHDPSRKTERKAARCAVGRSRRGVGVADV